MREHSKIQIKINHTLIGGAKPLICLPLVAKDKTDLLDQAEQLKALAPDLIEWRVDGYDNALDIPDCLGALAALQTLISPIPLIFTCRIEKEGGLQSMSDQARMDLMVQAMETGRVDILDTELCNDAAFIDTIIQTGRKTQTRILLSSHDFEKTPPREVILDKLIQAQQMGADIAKLAAMPQNHQDVLDLMAATLSARTGKVDIPLITISMGEKGAVSRVAGGLFGSDITFAVGQKSSAPGQIPIAQLRQAMAPLYTAPV